MNNNKYKLPGKVADGIFIYKAGYIKQVIYNNPATIVIWDDNTKTICKCSEKDTYNTTTGLLLCIMKRLNGVMNTDIKEVLNAWLPDNENIGNTVVTLKDVRKKYNK